MSEESTSNPTTSYWIIAGAMLVWNVIGLYFYYQQSILTREVMELAGMTVQQIDHIMDTAASLPPANITSASPRTMVW